MAKKLIDRNTYGAAGREPITLSISEITTATQTLWLFRVEGENKRRCYELVKSLEQAELMWKVFLRGYW